MASNIELAPWYPNSETAKRALGSIAQAVNERGGRVGLLGTSEEPLLELLDVDLVADDGIEPIDISIVNAKRDWSAVVWACLLGGVIFRIQGKKRPRAVLRRHPDNRHQGVAYVDKFWRGNIGSGLADMATGLPDLLRRLDQQREELKLLRDELAERDERVEQRWRHFIPEWRIAHGLPSKPMDE